jgi:hypothetical protein
MPAKKIGRSIVTFDGLSDRHMSGAKHERNNNE